jgi:thiosulfate/3-mercaptopyruvate sulfurtransferase
MKHIVSLEWLAQHLEDKDVVAVDCRFVLGRPQAGKESYVRDHIPGAFYMDLEQDLSGPKQEHGGRHPLPDLGAFSIRLGEIGIDASKTVVAYDDQGGAMASRFWWMLRFLSHTKVFVLDGGYTKWKEAGYPVTDRLPEARPAIFSPKVQRQMLISMLGVQERLGKPGTVLIDSREAKRYLGIEETIDPVAGHIPGAVHYFWKDGLTADGYWKSADEQSERFAGLSPQDEIVVYCGSGVTACPNVLALMEAGFSNVKLYSGSWSDWVSYPENPVATGEE